MSDPAPKSDLESACSPPFGSGRAKIPSWLLSLSLHAAVVFALIATLPGLRGGIVGDPAGDFRKIGIYVGRSGDGSDGETGTKDAPDVVPLPEMTAPPTANQMNPEPKTASVETLVPVKTPSVLGPGGATEKTVTPAPHPSRTLSPFFGRDSGSSATRVGSPGRGNGGPRGSLGSTSFFGIWDRGGKFVYVIDCSGSMFGHNAMQAAKKELLFSLLSLKRTQQFQIVFYNLKQKWITARGSTEFRYFAATDVNRSVAGHFTAEVQPDDGTDHLAALKLALQLHPDVLFFLTDAGEPGLNRRELDEIHRLNNRHTRLHCVHFSATDEPPSTAAPSFLRTLAAENNGDYVYRNVSRFAQAAKTQLSAHGPVPAKSPSSSGH